MPSQDYTVNDASDLLNEDLQNIDKFSRRATGWPGGMSYGYYNGCLVLAVHIRLRRGEHDIREFCATFYSARVVEQLEAREFVTGVIESQVTLSGVGDDHIEKPVLVKIVEFIEEAEKGRELRVPSIVRLRSLDSCLRSGRKGPNHRQGSVKVSHGASDWKLERPFHRGRVASAIANSESVDKSVESRAEIVDTVPGDQGPSIERRGLLDFDDESVAATLGITLSGDAISLAVLPQNHFSTEDVEVFFGTAKLEQTASELRSDHAIT
jgi:hypothetical protein